MSRLGFLFAMVFIVMVTGVSAGDIDLVSVHSQQEAELAETILGSAFARWDNRFVVLSDATVRSRLDSAGLEYQSLLANVTTDELYFVLGSEHPDAPDPLDLNRYGKPVMLGEGVALMPLARQSTAAIVATGDLKVVPLNDRSIRIKYIPQALSAGWSADFPSDSLVVRVNQDSLYAYNKRLEDFQTRYIYTDSIDAARDWIVSKFLDWGYTDVTTPDFDYGGQRHYNIKVVKPGTTDSDKVIVIGGHYDSWSSSQTPGPMLLAPGADDDGSGVAVTMELARILADVPLRKTIIFMPFSAEEVGLVGSRAAAADFVARGTKLEVMYNFDMVGNTSDSYWDFKLSSGINSVYRQLTFEAATRVTSLIPVVTSPGGSSDHASFSQQGFSIVNNHEGDFSPNWHSNNDLTSQMNFPYLAEVTRMSVASIAAVAEAPYPVSIDGIVDVGDGQSLEVHWTDCTSDCYYWVFWGVTSGEYTDSVMVAPGECKAVVDNLDEGVKYFFIAIGETPAGHRGLYGVEGTEMSLPCPRTPANFAGTSDYQQLTISWDPNREWDLSHYNIYRSIGDLLDYELYRTDFTETSYVDDGVFSQVGYRYYITAVDFDGYESPASEAILLFTTSFDGGILVVDEFTTENAGMPDQTEQEAWLDTIFGPTGFAVIVADAYGAAITTSDIGRFSSLVWIDDDVTRKSIENSEDVLSWYAQHETNLFVAGFRTILRWSSNPVPTNHLLYREFQVESYQSWGRPDFVGAHGQDGWPDLALGSGRGPLALVDIPRLTPRPGATVIYTYDSDKDRVETEGKICGLAWEGPNGKRVLLSFPLWNLDPDLVTSLMARVVAYFGDSPQQFDKGDLDNSGTIDIFDITLFINHLFVTLQPLANPQLADMDGYPGIDIGDLLFLINFLFRGGPAPTPALIN